MQHRSDPRSTGRRGLALIAAVTLTTLTLAACGSDSGGGAKSTTPAQETTAGGDGGSSDTTPADTGSGGGDPGVDACALLTDDDVKAAFAGGSSALTITTVTRTPQNSPGTAACDFAWTADNGSSSNFGLFVYGPDVYAALKADAGSQAFEALPGAYESFDGPVYGNDKVSVSVTGIGGDDTAAALLKAAADHAG